MSPIDFPEKVIDLQRPPSMTDEECSPLPVWRDGRMCVSCWRPTWREVLSIVFFRRIWLYVHMGNTQPPVALAGARTVFTRQAT